MTRAGREARQRGFTLAEVAIVVLIVGLLLGGLLGTYSSQVELSRIAETRRTLETARDALIGFAAANGRLPCPANAASNGAEAVSVLPPPTCNVSVAPEQQGVGFLPAATLGLTPIDSQGFLIDAWGSRVRYAVTNDNGLFTFTTQGQMRAQLIDLNPGTPQQTLLRICTTAAPPNAIAFPGTNNAACSGIGTTLTNSAVAVIFSVGKNGVVGGTGVAGVGLDEQANLNSDRVFISHDSIPPPSANEFDDIVVWLSPSILYNRVLSGGL
ncbi:MAG: prepilin-type N-terminal cleavage/methylation domain-containing protein [Burkholderiales bacterium]